MSPKQREMHFGVFVLGTGNHSAGWRYDGAATSNNDLSVIQEIARQAERGRFDLLFVSDGLVMDPGDHPSFLCRFEPTTLISALSASTRHIGLGATVSTSFGEPYHVARTFGSIDHITKGRAAWNVVTSSAGKAALNFSREAHMEHDLRYARRENMTLRDLYNLTAAARGHWVLCRTPKSIADTLEEWFVEEAADGFNVLPPYFPGALVDFVDLVVPELQVRGLFRREYEGTTLRDHFGLPRVLAPVRPGGHAKESEGHAKESAP